MRSKDKVHQKFLLTKNSQTNMIALQHIHAISSAEGPYCVLQKFNEHDQLKTQEALKLSFRASSLA